MLRFIVAVSGSLQADVIVLFVQPVEEVRAAGERLLHEFRSGQPGGWAQPHPDQQRVFEFLGFPPPISLDSCSIYAKYCEVSKALGRAAAG